MADINDPYASDTLTAIGDANQRARPEPPPPQRNWFMRDDNPVGTAGAAIGRGVAAGTTAAGAFAADIVGAFGDVQAGYGAQADPALLVDPEARKKFAEQSAEPEARVQSGAAFSSQPGAALYGVSAGFAPDPMTSNLVDRTLFGFSSTITRAAAYTALGGPVIGATLTGADVGAESAERLKGQGVDIGTRSAVGAVEGLGAGLGVVAPVAGKGLAQTAALVAGAGPGAYVAQTAATKAILQNAGYDKIAQQYDPLDPVNLAVATAVPAFFGGVHMATAKPAAAEPGAPAPRPLDVMSASELKAIPHNDPRLDDYATKVEQQNNLPPGLLVALKNVGERSNSDQVSSAGARGVMQFIDSTWNAYGKGDRTNPLNSIDAAGKYLPDLIKQYDGDTRAAVAAYNGGTKAGDAVHAGLQAPSKETRDYLNRVQSFLTDGGAQELAGRRVPTPDEVDAARVAQNRDMIDRANLSDSTDVQGLAENLTAFQRAQDQLGSGTRVEVSDLLRPEAIDQAGALDDMIGRMEDQHAELSAEAGNVLDRGGVTAARAELERLQSNPPDLGAITEGLRPKTTYTPTKTRAARDAAQLSRDAQAEYDAQLADHQTQIQRLQGAIDQNASADIARQQLQMLEPALQSARNARASIDAPATRRTAIADAVSQAARSTTEPRIPNVDTAPRESGTETAAGEPQNVTGETTAGDEPPIPDGFVRVYHGGLEMEGVTGRWVSADRKYAEGYAEKSAPHGRVFYADLPENDSRLVKAFDDEGTSVKAPFVHFELRDEEAASMHMLGQDNGTAGTADQATTAATGSGASPDSAPHLDAAVAELAAANPDAIVSIEVNGETRDVPLAEALAAIQAEAAREKADAPLLQVAANCFIGTGE